MGFILVPLFGLAHSPEHGTVQCVVLPCPCLVVQLATTAAVTNHSATRTRDRELKCWWWSSYVKLPVPGIKKAVTKRNHQGLTWSWLRAQSRWRAGTCSSSCSSTHCSAAQRHPVGPWGRKCVHKLHVTTWLYWWIRVHMTIHISPIDFELHVGKCSFTCNNNLCTILSLTY